MIYSNSNRTVFSNTKVNIESRVFPHRGKLGSCKWRSAIWLEKYPDPFRSSTLSRLLCLLATRCALARVADPRPARSQSIYRFMLRKPPITRSPPNFRAPASLGLEASDSTCTASRSIGPKTDEFGALFGPTRTGAMAE